MNLRKSRLAARWPLSVALALCCLTRAAAAKEVDQFSDRSSVFQYYAGGYRNIEGALSPAQVEEVLDARIDQLLDRLRQRLLAKPPRGDAERLALVAETFQHGYLPELVTPYEEWVEHESGLPLYRVRDKGIYGFAVNYDDMRMTWYIELSPVIMVAGVSIGLDKLGHFLAQGFQYCTRYEQLRSLSPAARLAAIRAFGHAQELGQLGVATGGIYSFADLASNWDGMLFFLALFEDVELDGVRHARYFARDGGGAYRRVRDFHWAEWVTPDWDEVLNPTCTEQRALYNKIVTNLWRRPADHASPRASICETYLHDPSAYLGTKRSLRPRSSYTQPEQARVACPHALDIRAMCDRSSSVRPR